MFKKSIIFFVFLNYILLLVSCNNDKTRIDKLAYNLSDITEFLSKREEDHLNVEKTNNRCYQDKEDILYNFLIEINYQEIFDDISHSKRSDFHLFYNGRSHRMYFYPNEHTIGIYYFEGGLTVGEAERFYLITENDFNILIEKIEIIIELNDDSISS